MIKTLLKKQMGPGPHNMRVTQKPKKHEVSCKKTIRQYERI